MFARRLGSGCSSQRPCTAQRCRRWGGTTSGRTSSRQGSDRGHTRQPPSLRYGNPWTTTSSTSWDCGPLHAVLALHLPNDDVASVGDQPRTDVLGRPNENISSRLLPIWGCHHQGARTRRWLASRGTLRRWLLHCYKGQGGRICRGLFLGLYQMPEQKRMHPFRSLKSHC